MSAQLQDYLHPNEARRFKLLFDLADAAITASDELTDHATVARVTASANTEHAITRLVNAIHAERREWLDLARERQANEQGQGPDDV